jgi:glucosamine--fructose-6-phosphate aminotransferase (isomerizing)
MKYISGKLPLEDFWQEFPDSTNGSSSPIELLDYYLTQTIDELSRPIDAIRHQAKTVTVGTSRKELPPKGIIFERIKELGFTAQSMSGRNIVMLNAVQPAISEVQGFTLYEIGNLDVGGSPGDSSTIHIRRRGGISMKMKSRVETSPLLMGTKRTIVGTGQAYIGSGKSDGASLVIIPFRSRMGMSHLLLIHVAFNESLSIPQKKEVLGSKYEDIRNLINEYNLSWDDRYLDVIPLGVLLGEPAELIREHMRSARQSTLDQHMVSAAQS